MTTKVKIIEDKDKKQPRTGNPVKRRGKQAKPTNKAIETTIAKRKAAQSLPTTGEQANESVRDNVQKPDRLLTILPTLTRNKIDVPKAVELRKHGLTYQEIATYFGCAKTSVHTALKKYGLVTKRVKVFRKHRGNILSELQEMILSSIDLKSIQKASMAARVLAFSILYDKERLERDLSTANVATLHDDIANLKAKKAKLIDK